MKQKLVKIVCAACALLLCFALFFACAAPQQSGTNTPPAAEENGGTGDGSQNTGDGSQNTGDGSQNTGDGTESGGMNEADKDVYAAAYLQIVNVFADAVRSKSAAALAMPLASQEEIYTEDPSSGTMWFVGAMTYIYLVTELYKNDSFVITDKPVEYTISMRQEDNFLMKTHIVMTAVADVQSGSVRLEYLFESEDYQNDVLTYTQKTYVYVDAAYDFAENEVDTLLIHIWDRDKNSTEISARYFGGEFKSAAPAYADEVDAEIQKLLAAFQAAEDQKITLGDFSDEFARANDYMYELINGDSGTDTPGTDDKPAPPPKTPLC